MIRVSWHSEARRELLAASRFYEQESSGLGSLFIDALHGALERLKVHPRSGRVIGGSAVRQYVVMRFPYSIFYRLEPDGQGHSLFVLAIAHQKRRPFYWASRR